MDLIAVEALEKGGVKTGKGEAGVECFTETVRVTDCSKATRETK